MSRYSLTLLLTLAAVPARAAEPATYHGHVKPFLARYCAECHHPGDPKAGLDLTTHKAIHAGSDFGPVLAPGKPGRDAEEWMLSPDRSWPFSFLNLCEALELAPDELRREVIDRRDAAREAGAIPPARKVPPSRATIRRRIPRAALAPDLRRRRES